MALAFAKGLNYVGNDVDMWEMDRICGKWLNNNNNNKWRLI